VQDRGADAAEDTRERLVTTALELFAERGYTATTVDDIAQQVGVTPRTFFRHFPDKEEVVFAADDRILPVLLDLIRADTEPVRADDLMAHVLGALADVLEPDRARLRQRQAVIDQHVALRGRELAKQGQWQDAIAEALTDRGVPPDSADLLAAIGFVVFRRCLHRWLTDDDPRPLAQRVHAAMPHVRDVLDATSSPGSTA
jgi:AcrR family transcriptional regulator